MIFEKHQETKLEYAWTGNLGQWYWDMKTNQVTFNPLKVITLGYDEEEIPKHVNYQYFTEKILHFLILDPLSQIETNLVFIS